VKLTFTVHELWSFFS